MFTGIVESIGTVTAVEDKGVQRVLTISQQDIASELALGESVAVNGVCLTVSSIGEGEWTADVMRVTLQTTNLDQVGPGGKVNLERAMRVDGRLGGHIVQGHVDAVATLVARDSQEQWDDLSFELPAEVLRYVVRKGSITLNGVSLTVAALEGAIATVSLIPTTLAHTTFGQMQVGDKANVEVDVVAKYVERLVGERA